MIHLHVYFNCLLALNFSKLHLKSPTQILKAFILGDYYQYDPLKTAEYVSGLVSDLSKEDTFRSRQLDQSLVLNKKYKHLHGKEKIPVASNSRDGTCYQGGGVVMVASNSSIASLFLLHKMWVKCYWCLLVSEGGVYLGKDYMKHFRNKESVIKKERILFYYEMLLDHNNSFPESDNNIDFRRYLRHPNEWFESYRSAGFDFEDMEDIKFIVMIPLKTGNEISQPSLGVSVGGICIPVNEGE